MSRNADGFGAAAVGCHAAAAQIGPRWQGFWMSSACRLIIPALLFMRWSTAACASTEPTLIGFIPDVGQATDVTVDPTTGRAYVSSIQFGLTVVDVANPSVAAPIGAANPAFYAEHVAASGSVATCISNTFGLDVVDLHDPLAPRTVSHMYGLFRSNVTMAGAFAYVAETIPGNPATATIDVIDLTTPASPKIVGRLDLGAVGVGGLKVLGSVLYVAAGTAGLKVVDISNPSSLRVVGSLALSDGASKLAIANGYLYLATATRVLVLDLRLPTAPAILGSLTTAATALAAANGRLYVLNYLQLQIIDVSNPLAPVLLGTTPNFGAQGLDAAGTIVYLASPSAQSPKQAGLYLVDVSLPQTPKTLSEIYNGFDNWGVAVASPLVAVVANTLGMRLVDVSNPMSPKTIGSMGGTLRTVALSGSFAYVDETVPGNPATANFDVVSLTNPASPTVVGRLNLGPIGLGGIKVVGPLAYLAAGTAGLKIVDVSTPSAPRIIGSLTPSDGAAALALANGYLYLATATRLLVVDARTPTAPTILGSLTTALTALAAANGFVYGINRLQLVIIDATNPSAPTLASSTNNFGAQKLDVSGTMLVLARPAVSHFDPAGGLYVLDVSNPKQPQVLEQVIVPGNTQTVVTDGGSYAYAGDSAAVVDIIRLPLAPPSINPASGTYPGPLDVTIARSPSSPEDTKIRYTTDGSDPGASTPAVASPVALRLLQSSTVKAQAVRTDYTDSAIVSRNYTLATPFTYRLEPLADVSVEQGKSATATVTATLLSGSAEPITYAATVSPANTVVASFSPAGCTPTPISCAVTLSMQTAANTPVGTYTITITGQPLSQVASFSLMVKPAPTPLATLQGQVTYYSDPPRGVPGVELLLQDAQGQPVASVTTDATGHFSILGLPSGSMLLTSKKTGGANHAITALDAVRVLQMKVGLPGFPIPAIGSPQWLACDVSGNGEISALDAVLMLQYAVGLRADFPADPSEPKRGWAMLPPSVPVALSGGQTTTQNVTAVLYGDCAGDWQP